MTTNVVNLPDSFEREFNAYWDAQLLEYPTITRNEAGEWNHFTVRPVADRGTAQFDQGADLARQSLRLAAQIREADGCALMFALEDAHKVLANPCLSAVARGFIDEILEEAVRGYTGLPRREVA